MFDPAAIATLRIALREALDVADAPTVVRFPKGTLPADVAAEQVVGGMDVLRRSGDEDVLVGRVRSDPTSPCGVQFWLALDPVRLAASCAVRLAELLGSGS